jgi:hypothetical protein
MKKKHTIVVVIESSIFLFKKLFEAGVEIDNGWRLPSDETIHEEQPIALHPEKVFYPYSFLNPNSLCNCSHISLFF